LSLQVAAQQNTVKHHRYKLVEIGTFGGPNSVYNVFSRIATNDGRVVGAANTADPDLFAPFVPYCFDQETCFVQHAWKWSRGVLTDLGALSEGYSSYTNAINSRGLIVGQSQKAGIDPLTGGPVLYLATVWDHGKIRNLGTFGGANSIAIAATDQNFVMGAAENGIVDTSDLSGFDGVSQIRAFGWNGGEIFDLGTLGGTDAFPGDMNNRGEVVGASTTTPFPDVNGIVPIHPFLWREGKMQDLGTLGGNFAGPGAINNREQIVGSSTLQGDQTTHPFLWQHRRMIDLGTLGGSYGIGEWLNDVGDVIGYSGTTGDQQLHGFIWRRGVMTDLGTVGSDNSSNAFGINVRGQVAGQSWFWNGHDVTASHAFLWENGGPMVDLNELVSPGSNLNLTEADFITDEGLIVARGFTPTGDTHTAILIPEGEACEFTPFAVSRAYKATMPPSVQRRLTGEM
jgi:probable HAF family extracellular repeat protein